MPQMQAPLVMSSGHCQLNSLSIYSALSGCDLAPSSLGRCLGRRAFITLGWRAYWLLSKDLNNYVVRFPIWTCCPARYLLSWSDTP